MKEVSKNKKKGFIARIIEKLDKKMEKSARSKPCCSNKNNSKGGTCCNK